MALNLTGLASGVDTDAIVAQLMAIERQKLSRYRLQESAIQGRDTALKDVQAKLDALKTTATDLKSASLWAETQAITSSDAVRVTGTRTGPITPGIVSVTVSSLAVAESRTFTWQDGMTDGTLSVNGVDITLPSASATVTDAVAAINAKPETGVTAANVDGKLQLIRTTTGAGQTITATGTTVVDEDTTKQRLGTDASFTVDGTSHTRSTNVVTDVVPGMTLTLTATTLVDTPVTLTVGEGKRDVAAIKEKLGAFVSAYNAVLDSVQGKVTEKKVKGAATSFDAQKGQLFGDRSLTAITSGLRQAVADVVAGAPEAMDQLAEIGVSVAATSTTISSEARLGKLTLDEAKLTAALESDPSGVQRLMGGLSGVDGFAQRIEKLVAAPPGDTVQLGYSDAIGKRLEGSTSETDRLRDQMSATERRLEAKEKRLRAQFAAMETAMAASQTQQSWLAGQIAGLQLGRA